jgi:molybdopterin-guanine dinucleotide biosynthesis protein A
MKNHMSAIILAGGKSKRMGGDKALLQVSGLRLIEKIACDIEPYFQEIIISSANSEEIYSFLPFPVVADKEKNQGPLMGILTGLHASKYPINFVVACDIPEINVYFLQKMMAFTSGYDIVVPVTGENMFEPLFAFYHKRVIPHIKNLLDNGVRKVIELFPLCRAKYISLEGEDWYFNLNTDEDYERYLKKLRGKEVRGKR